MFFLRESGRVFDKQASHRHQSQHDAQWRVSNYRSRPITHFLCGRQFFVTASPMWKPSFTCAVICWRIGTDGMSLDFREQNWRKWDHVFWTCKEQLEPLTIVRIMCARLTRTPFWVQHILESTHTQPPHTHTCTHMDTHAQTCTHMHTHPHIQPDMYANTHKPAPTLTHPCHTCTRQDHSVMVFLHQGRQCVLAGPDTKALHVWLATKVNWGKSSEPLFQDLSPKRELTVTSSFWIE